MKNSSIFALICVSSSLFFSSCSIQKRQHLPGYHITWHSSHADHHKTNFHTAKRDSLARTLTLVENASSTFVDTMYTSTNENATHVTRPSKDRNRKKQTNPAMPLIGIRTNSHHYANIQPTGIMPIERDQEGVYESKAFISFFTSIFGWSLSFAISSFALTLGGQLIFGMLVVILFTISLVYGIKAIRNMKANQTKGHGLALFGVILSSLFFLLLFLTFTVVAAL
jgi:hypothetical protein